MPTPSAGVDLYRAILARRSVRRYDQEPLDQATLAEVQEIAAGPMPLIPDNRMDVTLRDDVVRRDIVALLGAYGRLITPPHALVPYIRGSPLSPASGTFRPPRGQGGGTSHLLEDLGYRVEQIAVGLAALGIGSCYLGTLPREEKARALLGVPADARIGALLAFGRPAETAGGRALNGVVRSVLGRDQHPALERFFFRDSLDNPSQPPAALDRLVAAAAHAPSACNAQPWRFLWRDGQLWLFVTRNNRKYGGGASEQYCLYDGGIAMANISLAAQASGIPAEWQMVETADANIPPHPTELHPIARLVMSEH